MLRRSHTPLLTIVMIIWNTPEDIFRKSIESCLNQTVADLEVIAVDDHSTDGTWDIILEYAARDSRVKPLRTKRNYGGPNWTRRDGIKTAHGKWLIICDGDDYYELDAAEKLIKAAEEKNCDIAIGKTMSYNSNSSAAFDPYNFKAPEVIRSKAELAHFFFDEMRFHTWGRVFRISALRGLKWGAPKPANEDTYFTAQLVERVNGIAITPEVVYNYYINPEGITKKKYKHNFLFGLPDSTYYANKLLKKYLGKPIDLYSVNGVIDYYHSGVKSGQILPADLVDVPELTEPGISKLLHPKQKWKYFELKHILRHRRQGD